MSRGRAVPGRTVPGRRGFTRQPENSKRAHLSAPALPNTTKIPRGNPQREEKRTNFEAGKGKKKREILGPPTLLGPTLLGSTLRGPTFSRFGLHSLGPTLRLPQNSTQGPQEREKEERKLWRRREKKARNSGPPTLRGSTLLDSTLRGPTLRGPLFPGLASTLWGPPFEGPTLCRPKIQHPKIGRSRNWPKSKKRAGRSRNWPKSITPSGASGVGAYAVDGK